MTVHPSLIRPAVSPFEQRYLDLYASVSERLPGAQISAVRSWRQAAIDRFARLGLPHRRVEQWKYTDLRTLMPEVAPPHMRVPASSGDVDFEALTGPLLAGLDAYRAVFVDGLFRPGLSTIEQAGGVSFQPLGEALGSEEGAEKLIRQMTHRSHDVIAALTEAFAGDGVRLLIAPGAKLAKPIHLIFVGDGPHLSASLNIIEAGEGADLSLIETHAGGEGAQLLSYSELRIGAGASVKHVRTNCGGKYLASSSIHLGERTRYDAHQMTVDGPLTRAQLRIRFEGPHSRCHYAGAMMLRGRSHADFTLVVEHAAEACESRELIKAVVDDHSRGVFQGKVIVERGAQKTDGKQMANALLLSDDAEFDSKPELEIFADDVVCGHGATAGQLDGDMLFYLRARGIPEAQARALLIAAFVGEALDNIENETLRAALQEKANAWLKF